MTNFDKLYRVNAVKESVLKYEDVNDLNPILLHVKPAIPSDEVVSFIDSVVDNCFDEKTGAFSPYFLDYYYRLGVLMYFTDLELPKDNDLAYDFCYSTDIFDDVEQEISEHQARDIKKAIREKISLKKEAYREANDPNKKMVNMF